MSRFGAWSILLIAIVAEGVLLFLYWLWTIWRSVPFLQSCSSQDLISGVLATIPLLVVNGVLVYLVHSGALRSSSTQEFIDEIVKPLADELNLFAAIIVSLAAGFCEELFFRGAVMTEWGVLVSSVLFSVLHFGQAARKFAFLVIVYTGLGAYLAAVVIYCESIWPAIISHALYDFVALLYMRHCYPAR